MKSLSFIKFAHFIAALSIATIIYAEPSPYYTYLPDYYNSCSQGLCAEKITIDDYREIIVAHYGYPGNAIFYHNNGYGGFSVPSTIFSQNGCKYEMKLGQLQPSSPRKELALCTYFGDVEIYKYVGYSLSLHQTINLNNPNVDLRWCDWGKVYGTIYDDLVCSSDNVTDIVYIFRNNYGTLQNTPATIDIGANVNIVKLAELDYIYTPDYDELLCAVGRYVKIYNNEGGSFTFSQMITVGSNEDDFVRDIEVGDFNGDGYNDLVCNSPFHINVFLNNGDGTFDDDPGDYQWISIYSEKLALGELNYDGYPDLAVAQSYNNYIFECNGDGTFNEEEAWCGQGMSSLNFPYQCLEFADIHGKGAQSLLTSQKATDNSYSLWYYYEDDDDAMPCPPKNLEVENYNSHPLLTWRANTEDDFDHYEVFRKYVMVGGDTIYPWISIADDVTETQYLDEEVTYLGGTRNHARYYVRAWDRADDPTALMSIPSNTVIFFCYLPVSEGEISGISAITCESLDIFVTPNPFNPSTNLSYRVQETANVSLTVFDINGRQVANLVEGIHSAGVYSVEFNGSDLSSGVYFAVLNVDGSIQTQKLLLMK